MADASEERVRRAATAAAEEIGEMVHDPSGSVVKALLSNRNISEQDILIIANRKNVPGDVLEVIARDRRWADSYQLRLALAKNPKTPLFVALSLARYLRLPDLADLTRSRFLPLAYRHKVEAILIEKVPTMALGVKRTLAKTVSGNVLVKMMKDENAEVVRLCLNNPAMTEGHLFKIVTDRNIAPATIRAIAEHPNWSSRYTLRLALARSPHTPLARAVLFFRDLKSRDLEDLYRDSSVPRTTAPYIHNELMERGINVVEDRSGGEHIYDVVEEPEEFGPQGSPERSGEGTEFQDQDPASDEKSGAVEDPPHGP
jgi:predicted regulator of amino acid metabolism with ACT domain